MTTFHEVRACRICDGTDLRSVLDLGRQALTGVFPREKGAPITVGPLEIVKCFGGCGLVQLRHTYAAGEMYGQNYGYRSALNRAMVEHLGATVQRLLARRSVGAGDVVLDIGSNDGTTLSFYPETATLIGIDPTIAKFAKYYKPHIKAVADFFSADTFFRASGGKRAKIVTSISMFYDLDRPLDFARQVHEALADDGLWFFEQSYLPSMLAATSYDTICHEHVAYYALAQIVWIAKRTGFRIEDVSLNDVNGGSFAVTAAKAPPGNTEHAPIVHEMLAKEREHDTLAPFERFSADVRRHKTELRALLEAQKASGKRVFGYGASTKGNVMLQYCDIREDLVACIAEVNQDKLGCFTPGTLIPIVDEKEAIERGPNLMLVLPWHFRANILKRAQPIFERGISLLFPLPKIEIVSS